MAEDTDIAEAPAADAAAPAPGWDANAEPEGLVGSERVPGEFGRFTQSPLPGEEADWPFISHFDADVAALEPGQYYPKTM